ncbi:MAG: hypothetical protein IPM30_10405 [Burkholderiales bacterium]|nr:hypothetical protein [Burkholderiales bacterium]
MILPLAAADSLLERTGPPVAQVLARHGVDPRLIEAEVAAMAQAEIAKSANRSVLGTTKELAFPAGVCREADVQRLASPDNRRRGSNVSLVGPRTVAIDPFRSFAVSERSH